MTSHKDSEQLTYGLICDLLTQVGLSFETNDESMIQIHGSNGIYIIFTEELPWVTISHPANVRDSRNVEILKKAIDQYNLIMVKCRLLDNKQGGKAIEVYLQSIEQTFGHFKDSLGTYIYLLDRAFNELSDLYDKLSQEITK